MKSMRECGSGKPSRSAVQSLKSEASCACVLLMEGEELHDLQTHLPLLRTSLPLPHSVKMKITCFAHAGHAWLRLVYLVQEEWGPGCPTTVRRAQLARPAPVLPQEPLWYERSLLDAGMLVLLLLCCISLFLTCSYMTPELPLHISSAAVQQQPQRPSLGLVSHQRIQ